MVKVEITYILKTIKREKGRNGPYLEFVYSNTARSA